MNNKIKAEQLEVKHVDKVTVAHWKLLLLADPNKNLVQSYLQLGMTFAIYKEAKLAAIIVLQEVSQFKLEIKNIAVDPEFENQGIATMLFNSLKSIIINSYKLARGVRALSNYTFIRKWALELLISKAIFSLKTMSGRFTKMVCYYGIC